MTKLELRSKVDAWELAREAAEHELWLASERSERLSALEGDAEHLLEAYEERCVEALADLSPEERREVYKQLDLTVEAHPDGRLEAAWALNTSVSKVRGRSLPTSRMLEGCLQLRVPRRAEGPSSQTARWPAEMIRKVGSSGRVTFSLDRGDGACQREP
jgi:hypothetical protein